MLGFESLNIWKEGMDLCKSIYGCLQNCRDFGLRDQMQRAAVSIPSNIAEGYERKTDKEFIQFLYVARGSCGELRTQLYLAVVMNYIPKEKGIELIEQSKKLSGMIFNFIQYKKQKELSKVMD